MSHVVVEGAAPEFTLTDRLRKAREHGGLDQAELAGLMGMSERSIRNYESGRSTPRRPQLIAWAFATGVALDWLEGDVRPKGFEPLTFWSVFARWVHKSALVRRNTIRVTRFATRITCPRCGRTSFNPNDVREGYCGNCHDWTDGVRAEDLALAA
jgi:transcriptional regulator with XRE-family HTH domain